MSLKPVPLHGSRRRYRNGCRCLACSRSNYRIEDRPTELRWPIRFLLKRHSKELITDYIGAERMAVVEQDGLEDFEADEVAIRLGDHPMMIWPGWIEAGEHPDVIGGLST